jgi:hypothetical protein
LTGRAFWREQRGRATFGLQPETRSAPWIATALTIVAVAALAGCAPVIPSSRPSLRPPPTAAAPAPTDEPTTWPTVASGRSAPGDSVVAVDAASGEVIAVLDVGPDPKVVASAAGQVWTLNLGDGGLSRIDPAALTVTPVRVEGEAVGMAADGNDVWVAHAARFLSRIDGRTGDVEKSLTLADEPLFALRNAGFLAVEGATVWLTVPVLGHILAPHELWEVDAASGARMATYTIGRDPLWPTVTEDAVWVPVLGGVSRLDLVTREVVELDDLGFPAGLDIAADAVWVAVERRLRVLRLDPLDGTVIAEIQLDARPRGITVGRGSVWTTTEAGLVEVDPATNTIRRTIPLVTPVQRGSGPTDVGYVDGVVWVAIE